MIFLKDPDSAIDVPFDWNESLATGITLLSASHSVPTGLTKTSESTDTANGLSRARVSGGSNGVLYIVEAQGTLSSGEIITKRAPVRCCAS